MTKAQISSGLNSVLALAASLAISVSVLAVDVGSASGFVASTARRLQSDELATVRLFEDNTPSVVYITNLAVRCGLWLFFYKILVFWGIIVVDFFSVRRQDAFTLDVLEVPQGSGSGFVWDREGHIVTNYHVIRGASDLRLVCVLLTPLKIGEN